jgi:hypothetical protein
MGRQITHDRDKIFWDDFVETSQQVLDLVFD